MINKIFITGSSGFIGRNLREYLADKYEVLAPCHNELNLLDDVSVKNFLQKQNVDIVIHAATHNATPVSHLDRSMVLHNNLKMFYTLEKYHDLYGKMFYFGSGAEYGRDVMEPMVKEEDFGRVMPKDDYGLSKYIMNKTAAVSKNIYNLRLFGVYGKYEDDRIRFISNNICRAQRGEPYSANYHVRFDYLYIDDLCRLTEWFIGAELRYHTYNVCTGKSVDLYEIAGLIKQVMTSNLPILLQEDVWQREYSGDNTRMMQEIDSFAFTDMGQGIKSLVQWYCEGGN